MDDIDMLNGDDAEEGPETADPFQMLRDLPPATARGVYAGCDELLRACIEQQRYFVAIQKVPMALQESRVEAMAGVSLSCGCVTWRQLECILRLLPTDRTPRWAQSRSLNDSEAPKTFLTGAWARGPHGGLSRHFRDYPVTSRLLAAIIRAIDPDFRFSSCTLSRNTCAKPHRDSHNSPGSMNLIIPCSRFEGGGLWLQHGSGTTALDSSGPPGFVMDVCSPLRFAPSDLHATLPWQGCRLVLIAFHVRNVHKMSVEDLTQLQEAGFVANTMLP
eukprot:s3590_g13.t1